MEKRRLGRTDIEVTPVGMGCWQFSQGQGLGGKFWPVIDSDTITSIVKTGLEKGINWFDTAEMYGNGRSEQVLSASLQSLSVKPGNVVIATKWNPFFRTSASIRKTIEQRLGFLNPYPIDLYQIHMPRSLSPIPAQMKEMAALARAGKIRAVGVSNFSAQQMRVAHAALAEEGIVLASNQVRYSLLDRTIESNGVMETAKELGVSIIAYSPLAQGILTGKFHDDPKLVAHLTTARRLIGSFSAQGLARTAPLVGLLREIAAANRATPSQVALAWLLGFHGNTVLVIPGASKPRQAEESAGAMGLHLSANELEKLDRASRDASARTPSAKAA